jgi:hypothetical protein
MDALCFYLTRVASAASFYQRGKGKRYQDRDYGKTIKQQNNKKHQSYYDAFAFIPFYYSNQ